MVPSLLRTQTCHRGCELHFNAAISLFASASFARGARLQQAGQQRAGLPRRFSLTHAREPPMTKYVLFGAALLATTFVNHVHAQPSVEDPGYCAEFYPNANCPNLGP